jgi:hypothetical protein
VDRGCEAALASLGDQPQPTDAAAAAVARVGEALRRERESAHAELARVREHNRQLELELQTTRERLAAVENQLADSVGSRPAGEAGAGSPLKLISKGAEPEAIDRRLVEYAAHLFEHIGVIYKADVDAMSDLSLIVERLAANLRHARAAFGRRLESCGGGDAGVFDTQLALLLDAESQTAFGRHLAIAAYSGSPRARAEAS